METIFKQAPGGHPATCEPDCTVKHCRCGEPAQLGISQCSECAANKEKTCQS